MGNDMINYPRNIRNLYRKIILADNVHNQSYYTLCFKISSLIFLWATYHLFHGFESISRKYLS